MLHHRRTGSDGTPAADIDIISDAGANADMGALPHRYCSAQGGIGRDMDIISQHIVMLHDCSGVDDTVAAHCRTGVDHCTGHNNGTFTDGSIR